jgi:hypothetical protein
MVLASVIIGLGITHLLQGVAGIAQHPGREKVYWVHLVWVAVVFLRVIFWWWFEFRLSGIASWSFALYFFVLSYAFVIYLTCALLFPKDLADYDGFKDYFYSRKNWFFGINLAGIGVDVADSLFKGLDHFQALGTSYPIIMAVLASLFTIALWTRSERFHAAFAVASLAYLLVYPISVFDSVQ